MFGCVIVLATKRGLTKSIVVNTWPFTNATAAGKLGPTNDFKTCHKHKHIKTKPAGPTVTESIRIMSAKQPHSCNSMVCDAWFIHTC